MNDGGSITATVAAKNGEELNFSVVETPTTPEELDAQLGARREQLLTLRRQQEELERQKGDLEELRRKQDEYVRGKREMTENLTRALVIIEREQIEAQRLSDLCGKTTEAFRDYADQLAALNDEEWTSDNVRTELSRALGVIENSRMEFNRARIKLDCLNPVADQPAVASTLDAAAGKIEWNELMRYVAIGAAASAPLILAGTVWLIVALVIR